MKKVALVDWKGNIILRRYYLLYAETPGAEFWPNIYLQVHVDPRGIDGSSGLVTFHKHPWSAAAIILRGGYTEIRSGARKVRRALSGYFISKATSHAVVEATPGTVSLFFHWFKRQEWLFKLESCEVLCAKCSDGLGVCERTVKDYNITDITNTSRRARSGQTWMSVDSEFEGKIRRRREALQKIGDVVQEVSTDEYFYSGACK